jgi:hypothetical protein
VPIAQESEASGPGAVWAIAFGDGVGHMLDDDCPRIRKLPHRAGKDLELLRLGHDAEPRLFLSARACTTGIGLAMS